MYIIIKRRHQMRIFKVSPELKEYILKILDRRKIPYFFRGENRLGLDISGNAFHKIVLRAKCEKRNFDENLDFTKTYFVKKIEHFDELKVENPDWQIFIDF